MPEELEAARDQAKARLDEALKAQEREKEYSSALMDYFDKVEEALKEQKRQKEQETQKDVKQQEADDNRDTDN